MNLTKITAAAGVAYLLKSIVRSDGGEPAAAGAVAYYTQPGTPAGVWMGSGAPGLGLRVGDEATREQAVRLFSAFLHPRTAEPLGLPPKQLHAARAQESPDQVSGFDLTFRVPKSVSVLWGVADPEVQAQIMAAHHEAIATTLAWFEQEVASTRSGRTGVASSAVRGVAAIAYDHFETRDGDPHLHTHLAVANRVQRASDGKWLTLDGRTMYRSAVAMSELHENALLDLLHDRLGMVFTERPRPDARSARSVVADVAGFPAELVDRFSARRFALQQRRNELEAQWRADHPDAVAVPRDVAARFDAQAWRQTRKPKAVNAAPLTALTRRWREQVAHAGLNVADLMARVLDHDRTPAAAQKVRGEAVERLARLAVAHHLAGGDQVDRDHLAAVTDDDVEAWLNAHDDDAVHAALAETVHAGLARRRATWTRFNARAEVERLTRLVRFRPDDRQTDIDAITEAALRLCVPITPHRYELPERAATDPRIALNGHTVFDNPSLRLFTSQVVLDAETFLNALTDADDGVHVAPTDVDAALRSWLGTPLAADQAAAVRHLTATPATVTALVGPAGSGKTTTMRAVHHTWTTANGRGSVIGVAPSARAAHELGASVGIDTHTLAMLLNRNTPDARAQRAARRSDLAPALTSTIPRRRAAALRALAQLDAEEASYTLRAGTLVVVDEASMCSTHDLATLARLAVEVGAKVALVGDPAQLDAIDAGGFLGWLDRQGKAARLTSLFRFEAQWEAVASLRLRDGDATVLFNSDAGQAASSYGTEGRIHDGEDTDMLDAAYAATRTALAEGRTAVLIAATNDHVADLNLRTTLDRREAGEVDTTRTVALRGEQDAGTGDLIYTRMNDYRTLRDDTGVPIHNGDLLRVTHIGDDGAVTCERVDTGATISLPATYLAAHCDLGYALTAHRAQGITVDEAHLFIPYGARMTRELLYVAMTRGRANNSVWVGLPDPDGLAHENRSPWETNDEGEPRWAMPNGASILARALAAVGAEQTAHEQRDAEIAAHTNLGRLVAEHEVLASHAVAPGLADHLATLHPAIAFTTSPAWDALVSTFRHAHAVNPERALRLVRIPPSGRPTSFVQGALGLWDGDADGVPLRPFTTSDDDGAPALDPTAVLHWRLASALVHPAPVPDDDPAFVAGQVARIHTHDPALADLARQSETLIAGWVAHLARKLDDDPPPWTELLPPAPVGDPAMLDAWRRARLAVAVYRDAWQVTAPTPLGPTPIEDRRRLRHYQQALAALTHWREPRPGPDLSRPYDDDPYADIDWAARDLGDATTDIPSDAGTSNSDPSEDPIEGAVPPPRSHPRAVDNVDTAVLDRIGAANAAALEFWRSVGANRPSWIPDYLAARRLTGVVSPAHAPAGWTTTLDHLRAAGFTDAELLDAGLAARAATGRVIDRFRDRLALPIYDDIGRIAGFTARANPTEVAARPDTPKYLNTATTAAYDKSRLLYGLTPGASRRLADGATPVLVEGPLDAAAIDTLGLDVVPLATCGTAVTADHLAAIAAHPGTLDRLIVAFDADAAGRSATARLWSLLGPDAAGRARQAAWTGAKDPGELVEATHTAALAAALEHPRPLAVAVVEVTAAATIARLDSVEGQVYVTRAVAAEVVPTRNPDAIAAAIEALANHFGPDAPIEGLSDKRCVGPA